MINKNKHNAFTIIELLVVVTIIGILIAISTFSLSSSRKAGRDAERKSELEAIRAALELYKSDNVTYPLTADVKNALVPGYLEADAFTDPRGDPYQVYSYCSSDGATYAVCASLEGSDSGSGCDCTAGCGSGITCNYMVKNP